MAASLVFRPGFCICHRSLLKSHPKSAFMFSRTLSNSRINTSNTKNPFHDGPDGSSLEHTSESNNSPSQQPHSFSPSSSQSEGALHKFAKIVDRVKGDESSGSNGCEENETFASMLRNSKLISLAEVKDKRVLGQIVEVMEDDLYIDFGGKFHCVCPRPRRNAEKYQRGSRVVVSLNSQEMSSAFLGSDIHVTLLEADAVLLGLATLPKTKDSSKSPTQ